MEHLDLLEAFLFVLATLAFGSAGAVVLVILAMYYTLGGKR